MAQFSDRDDKGRFAKGNAGGPGRPKREVERDYLQAIRDTISRKDIIEIAKRAVRDAKGGDGKARDWISRYLLPETSGQAAGGSPSDLFIIKIPAGVRDANGD